VAIKEKEGHQIMAYRFSASYDSNKKFTKKSEGVPIQWRRPGSRIWFSWPRFIVEYIGDRLLMVSTAQGSRVLRFMFIDFEKDRVGDSLEIRAPSNTTISHFSCKNS
jgi:hypothetical protein